MSDNANPHSAASTKRKLPTDDELRDRWLKKVGKNVAYTRDEFLRYDKGVWTRVEQMLIRQEITAVHGAEKGAA